MSPVIIPSFTGGIVERYDDEPKTYAVKSGQTVRGGRLVEVTNDLEVQEAGAISLKVAGVALHDADPSGEIKKVTVSNTGSYDLLASGSISPGDLVVTAVSGQVSTLGAVTTPTAADVTGTRAIVGMSIATITNGNTGTIELRLGS